MQYFLYIARNRIIFVDEKNLSEIFITTAILQLLLYMYLNTRWIEKCLSSER